MQNKKFPNLNTRNNTGVSCRSALSMSLLALSLGLLLTGCDNNDSSATAGNIPESQPKPETPNPDVGTQCKLPNSDPVYRDEQPDITVTKPLYRYIDNNGVYDYSTEEVPLYAAASSNLVKAPQPAPKIQIPVAFVPKKHQIRSTWIATIGNLTMGKSKTVADLKQQFGTYLAKHEELNMNALIFQVRPLLDTWYPSTLNPWSEFLSSGTQGVNSLDDPNFDPLKYMVEETHKRSMEFHAWFNPYRVTNTKLSSLIKDIPKDELLARNIQEQIALLNDRNILADNNFAVLNPDDVYIFDEKLFLNPSRENVIQHVADTVREVVENYDIDAIHFDDYFYPYRISGTNYFGLNKEDRDDFVMYGIPADYPDTQVGLEQWRRNNVTKLIIAVKNVIDNQNTIAKTSIQFGVSPFGIWEHVDHDPAGSNTPVSSSQSYSQAIFADTKGWIDNGYLDYVVPQIYWALDTSFAPYGELAHWWNDIVKTAAQSKNPQSETTTQLYIGHANYKHASNAASDPDWANPEEIPNQLLYNQTQSHVDGSIYFSYNELVPNDLSNTPSPTVGAIAKNGSIEILKDTYLTTPVLPPSKPWLDHKATLPPIFAEFLVTSDTDKPLNMISWKDTPDSDARYYVIYRGLGDPDDIFANPKNIYKKVWRGGGNSFVRGFSVGADEPQYTYLISAIDAAQNESDYIEVKVSKSYADEKGIQCE